MYAFMIMVDLFAKEEGRAQVKLSVVMLA